MTDQELNELLATKVMGSDVPQDWNPCENYDHVEMVEGKLLDHQKARQRELLNDPSNSFGPLRQTERRYLYASARQRCEAIWKVVTDGK